MQIYQFLIAVRQGGEGHVHQQLTNEAGEITSHIQGMFNRTVRFLEGGIKPVYVFDGKPPSLKSGELVKRREMRQKAEEELKKAKEAGDVEAENMQQKRLVRAGTKENNDCKKLLRLMGCPVVEAPCEAEAQCAALCKAGKVSPLFAQNRKRALARIDLRSLCPNNHSLCIRSRFPFDAVAILIRGPQVYASATEDMDCLTFATPVLLRKMGFAKDSKSDIQVLQYQKALDGLKMNHDQFVDLCILLGCDYCDSIRGIGPVSALKLIREHGNIETILKKLDRKKYTIPESWLTDEKKPETTSSSATACTSTSTPAGEVSEYKSENSGGAANSSADSDSPSGASDTAADTAAADTAAAAAAAVAAKSESKEEKDADEVDNEPVYVKARRLFKNHEVREDCTLKWTPPDEPGLVTFLVDEMGFNGDRVKVGIEKIKKAHKTNSKPQMRMDSFFSMKKAPTADALAKKREAEKAAKKSNKKSKKAGSGFNRKR